MSRRSARIEFWNTICFAVVLAAIDPGVVAVLVKHEWTGVVEPWMLNLTVAFVGATGELSNIFSFIWSPINHARPKVPFVNVLQTCVIASILCMAWIPSTPAGLVVFALLVLFARICWSGIITVRPTIWRANYSRAIRAKVVGRFGMSEVVISAAGGLLMGWALDMHPDWLAYLVTATCIPGAAAVFIFSRLRVRREASVLREERARPVMKPWHGPLRVWQVLRTDPLYARFMLWMFILGFGNLMLPPLTVLMLKEQFALSSWRTILVIVVVPKLIQAVSIPLWARFLDRAHVVRFRSIHSWVFVLACGFYMLGAWLHVAPLIFIGSALMGLGYGGGALAWNLGHTDFAPVSETSNYMATHLTLNGLRGLLAPFASVTLYQWLTSAELEAGTITYFVALILSIIGGAGFVHLRIQMQKLLQSSLKRP